jgi:hypothetical protein
MSKDEKVKVEADDVDVKTPKAEVTAKKVTVSVKSGYLRGFQEGRQDEAIQALCEDYPGLSTNDAHGILASGKSSASVTIKPKK